LVIVKALPEDLKTKLSLDDDVVASPKDALSRASADRAGWRLKNLKRCRILSWPFCYTAICYLFFKKLNT